jgi:hypothetical protein
MELSFFRELANFSIGKTCAAATGIQILSSAVIYRKPLLLGREANGIMSDFLAVIF